MWLARSRLGTVALAAARRRADHVGRSSSIYVRKSSSSSGGGSGGGGSSSGGSGGEYEKAYPKMQTVLDVLRYSGGGVRYVFDDQRVADAMKIMIDGGVGSLMVKDRKDRLVGFLTQRDLLRAVVRLGKPPSVLSSQTEPTSWNEHIKAIMTPSRELVFLTPKDTLSDARALMSVSGKRHIPVLSGNSLLGIMSPKDIARMLHQEMSDEVSAKESYVSTVMPRKGMPLATKLVDKEGSADSDGEQIYALASAVANLPHPHKESLGEDAFLLGPNMVGVADGVGSWWEMDVDPAVYARGLMHCTAKTCVGLGEENNLHARRPTQVLHEAWHEMSSASIVGSCTACLVALHPHKSELLATNVGDSGFIIVRHTPDARSSLAEPRGTLDVMGSPRRAASYNTSAGHGRHVAFRSPQQLRGFNAPYQLGRAPDVAPGEADDRFETPHDAALVRVPIKGGDLVVLATDGLFDNMPESTILEIIDGHPDASEEELAKLLATRAQELSLDKTVDSPFARRATDNDIMWGGGRPDDITVIVTRIVDTTREPKPTPYPAITGPGPAPEEVRGSRPRGGPVAALGEAKKQAMESILKEDVGEW